MLNVEKGDSHEVDYRLSTSYNKFQWLRNSLHVIIVMQVATDDLFWKVRPIIFTREAMDNRKKTFLLTNQQCGARDTNSVE